MKNLFSVTLLILLGQVTLSARAQDKNVPEAYRQYSMFCGLQPHWLIQRLCATAEWVIANTDQIRSRIILAYQCSKMHHSAFHDFHQN